MKSHSFVTEIANTLSEITACVEGSFGPYGRDKLIVQPGGTQLITNTGHTILNALLCAHPVAKYLSSIVHKFAETNGDGSTGLLLMISEAFRKSDRINNK
eukprot:267447_1